MWGLPLREGTVERGCVLVFKGADCGRGLVRGGGLLRRMPRRRPPCWGRVATALFARESSGRLVGLWRPRSASWWPRHSSRSSRCLSGRPRRMAAVAFPRGRGEGGVACEGRRATGDRLGPVHGSSGWGVRCDGPGVAAASSERGRSRRPWPLLWGRGGCSCRINLAILRPKYA